MSFLIVGAERLVLANCYIFALYPDDGCAYIIALMDSVVFMHLKSLGQLN